MTFGEKLYAMRRQAGYSQEDLAEKLDVTRQAVSRWESGTVLPDAPNLLQLGRLFDVSIDYLLKDELTEAHPAPPAQGPADPPQPPADAAPPVGKAPPRAGFPLRRPGSWANGVLLLCLAMEAVGCLLSFDFWYSRSAPGAYLFLNVLGVFLFEGFTHLLLAAPEARAAHRLRFYRIAVWFLAWFPLGMATSWFWLYYPGPHPSFVEPLSLLAVYLFLCGGVSYAACRK